jgi:hypothetical protein
LYAYLYVHRRRRERERGGGGGGLATIFAHFPHTYQTYTRSHPSMYQKYNNNNNNNNNNRLGHMSLNATTWQDRDGVKVRASSGLSAADYFGFAMESLFLWGKIIRELGVCVKYERERERET